MATLFTLSRKPFVTLRQIATLADGFIFFFTCLKMSFARLRCFLLFVTQFTLGMQFTLLEWQILLLVKRLPIDDQFIVLRRRNVGLSLSLNFSKIVYNCCIKTLILVSIALRMHKVDRNFKDGISFFLKLRIITKAYTTV